MSHLNIIRTIRLRPSHESAHEEVMSAVRTKKGRVVTDTDLDRMPEAYAGEDPGIWN